MFKSIEEQLNIIKRGVLEVVREEELVEKLKEIDKNTNSIAG